MTDQAIKAAKEMRDEAVRIVNISEANRGPLLGDDTRNELRAIADRIRSIPIPWAPEPKFDSRVVHSGTTTSILLMLRNRGMYQTENYVGKLAQESDAKDATIAQLSAQVGAAREALEPFAKFAEKAEAFVEFRVGAANDASGVMAPTKDFRLSYFTRARAALAKLSEEA